MSSTPAPSPDMVGVATERLRTLWLRCFAHLPRKPQQVADVKAGKRPDTFNKHRRDYWAMYQKDGDLRAILAGIDELRADVATWAGHDMVGAVDTEHLSETEAQGKADVLVLLAAKTDEIADIERAYDAQAEHVHRGKRLVKSLGKRLAERRRELRTTGQRFGITPKGRAS